MSVGVRIDDLKVRLGGNDILHGVSLDVQPGEFLTLLGPSGSGKTTMLNVIAGFIKQHSGHVSFDGQSMDRVRPHQRDVGIVFQNYALFPHLTAGENVAFPLRTHSVEKGERARRVSDALKLVGLEGMEGRRTTSLSGGQQQRVALARAIVFQPRLLLLDEPLAALDKGMREIMQVELKRIQSEVGITTIAVTHDQIEALTMSTRIAIMNQGRLDQLDTPEALYRQPATRFVAEFLGEANIFEVDAERNVGSLGIRLPGKGSGCAVIRPEDIGLVGRNGSGAGELTASVESADFQGSRYRVVCRKADGVRVVVTLPPHSDRADLFGSDKIKLCVPRPERIHVIPDLAG